MLIETAVQLAETQLGISLAELPELLSCMASTDELVRQHACMRICRQFSGTGKWPKAALYFIPVFIDKLRPSDLLERREIYEVLSTISLTLVREPELLNARISLEQRDAHYAVLDGERRFLPDIVRNELYNGIPVFVRDMVNAPQAQLAADIAYLIENIVMDAEELKRPVREQILNRIKIEDLKRASYYSSLEDVFRRWQPSVRWRTKVVD